ncbi:hypothetical protein ACRS3X_07545 [Ectopseudomonas hydrolytica]|uniref:hypothetical protein n=1 Tax=Ectopseudomonas hydrolytica TaxID=2493633 RepID=UPI003EE334AD
MSFTLEKAQAAEPKVLANGMKSFDHFRQLAGNPKLDEFFVDASELERLLPGLPLAGDSALEKLSMIADNSYKTYAVGISEWNASGGLDRKREVEYPPASHKIGYYDGLALVEVWVINPPVVTVMHGDLVVESLHLALSYTDEKRFYDERVSLELGNMLEELGYEFENRWS